MISPEDIDNVVAEKILRDGLRMSFPNTMVAAILNAAIEAGVVSPPCRILRSRFGGLQPGIYKSDNEAQSHASPGDSSEHWKGQTS